MEISFLVDVATTLNSPKNILDNVCWDKGHKLELQREFWKRNFRYRSLSNDSTIFEQFFYPYFYTVLVSLDCDFEVFLERALETTLVKYPNVWVVLGEYEQIKRRNYYIPISSLFVIPVPNTFNNHTEIKSIYKINKNSFGFIEETVGNWSDMDKLNINLVRGRTNFRGMPLRVSYIVTDNGTLDHFTDYREKHLDNLTKINYILYDFICDLLNATHVRLVARTWGFETKNSTFSRGMFEDLVNDRSDVAGTVSFTPASRLKYFKFIFAPIKDFSPHFVFRAPSLAYYTNLFVLPFDKMVFVTIGFLLVSSGFLIHIIFTWEIKENAFKEECKDNGENDPNFLDVVMMQIAIMCQMDFFYEPKSISGKMATFVVLITCTFIYTAFSARIVLLLQSTTNKIDNLDSLYAANFDFGVESQPYNLYYFQAPNDRTNEYWRHLIYEHKIKKPGKDNFLNAAEGMKLVRDSYFAFHVEQTVANYLIDKTFSNNQKCSLKVVETIYKADVPYLAAPRNSPYIEFLIVSFRRLAETGIHNREYRRCFTKKPSCEGTANNFVSVGLTESYFPFLVFGSGICLSIFVLILEDIAHVYLKIRCVF